MKGPDIADDETRRTVLKTLAATGVAGTGIAATAGSSMADSEKEEDHGEKDDDHGKGEGQGEGCGQLNRDFKRFKREVKRDGKIVDECDEISDAEMGDEVTFKGHFTITAVNLNDADELLLSGRIKGKLTGFSDGPEKIDARFDNVSLGRLREIFTVHPVDDEEECPIVDFHIGRLFRQVLGIELATETIEIDIIAIFGEDNIVSDILCSIARRFSPQAH